ncbi:hypothetical protein C8R44DRAFT_752001 [Mycena epipterygia]|nr:hypothetical protein C8R44DRAFT_752001 [Mycena epipterygia]
MPTKVLILAQFEVGHYIRGTLKRLTDDVDWRKAWWSCVFWFGSELGESVWAWFRACSLSTRNPCLRCLGGEEMPAKVRILAQFEVGYYIRGTLKWLTDDVDWLTALWIHTGNPCHCCLASKEMPTKVLILAQFEVGYYIGGTLKRLTDDVDWLKAWWIHVFWLVSELGGSLYYIRETLKWLTDVLAGILAGLRAWWIFVGVKQFAEQKSMPLLPRRRGNAHKSCDFGSV